MGTIDPWVTDPQTSALSDDLLNILLIGKYNRHAAIIKKNGDLAIF